jgi:tRNA (guanine37-N1)-methyltransferase
MWRASVLTIFPEMFPGPLGLSLAGKAIEKGVWALDTIDIRNHATDKHRTVDDTPAGGGPGMVMKADVLARAIDAAGEGRPRLMMSPRGAPLTQARVAQLAAGPGAILVCGRFEGVDERVIEGRNLEEVSLGDFVLSGGEIAAFALMDACVRLLPGVMGRQASGAEESFAEGLLEYPHYTRPQLFEGRAIPEVLVSGDHAKVAAWRRAETEKLTQQRRPDLWESHVKGLQASRGSAGPHEGREFQLMKDGKKPLCMFLDEGGGAPHFPERDFDTLVAEGRLVKRVSLEADGNSQLRRVIYALSEEQWRIEALLLVLGLYASVVPGWRPDLDRVIGVLLGYERSEIESFVKKITTPQADAKVG